MHIRNSNDGQLSQLKNVLNLYNLGILLKTQIRGLWFSNTYYVHIKWIIITDSVHIQLDMSIFNLLSIKGLKRIHMHKKLILILIPVNSSTDQKKKKNV